MQMVLYTDDMEPITVVDLPLSPVEFERMTERINAVRVPIRKVPVERVLVAPMFRRLRHPGNFTYVFGLDRASRALEGAQA